MVVALPELLALAALILALGLVTLGSAFTEALFQVADSAIGWVPWLGSKAKAPLHAIQKRINSRMSAAALGLEGAISSSWHVLATLVEETGQALWETAQAAAHVAWLVEVKYPLHVIKAVTHTVQRQVIHVTRVVAPSVQRVTVVQKVNAGQLRSLARRVATLEARTVAFPYAGAGSIALPLPRVGSLERRIRGWAGRIAGVEHRLGRLPFIAAVSGALAALGVSWARRSCAKRTADAWCRVDPDLFDSIFAATTLIVGSISLVQLTRETAAVLPYVANATAGFVRETRDTWEAIG